MKLEDQIVNDMMEELKQEIDFGVMSQLMVESGWHRVELEPFTSNRQALDITFWIEAHANGRFIKHGRTFVFEDSKDALMFMLKWK